MTTEVALLSAWLWPELTVRVATINDSAFHGAFVRRAAGALWAGEDLIDHWVPQFGLGFPEFLYYQHLPHVAAVFLHVITLQWIDPMMAFQAARYALLISFPLTVYWSLRRFGLPPAGALVGAAAAPLISTDHLYGFDLASYVWRGFGMYTQLWAMHLTFITFACIWHALERGRGYAAVIVSLAALVLSHQLFAYLVAIGSVVLVLAAPRMAGIPRRAVGLALIGLAAALIASYFLVPALATRAAFLEMSYYLQPEKYDSFGAPRILDLLSRGQLFDHGRPPVLTVLTAGGVAAAAIWRSRLALVSLVLFAVFLILYFGRPTLGPLVDLMPLDEALYLHRFIAGVHFAAILLVGVLGAVTWRAVATRPFARWALVLGLGVAMTPALVERHAYLAQNETWLRQTAAAVAADADLQRVLDRIRVLGPGRTYAGLRTNWGASLSFTPFRSVTVFNMLTDRDIPEVAPPYAGPSLNSDLMFHFDDADRGHYEAFNVRYVIASPSIALPTFLRPIQATPRYVLYEAPSSGFAQFVNVRERRAATGQTALFEANRAWLLSSAPAERSYIRWDYPAAGPTDGVARPACSTGGVTLERVAPARLEIQAQCDTPSPLLLKVTYHPNWSVTVDGSPTPTYMLSPSLLGIDLPAGSHVIVAEYRSTPEKGPLLALGAVTTIAVLASRGRLPRLNERLMRGMRLP